MESALDGVHIGLKGTEGRARQQLGKLRVDVTRYAVGALELVHQAAEIFLTPLKIAQGMEKEMDAEGDFVVRLARRLGAWRACWSLGRCGHKPIFAVLVSPLGGRVRITSRSCDLARAKVKSLNPSDLLDGSGQGSGDLAFGATGECARSDRRSPRSSCAV